MLAAVSCLLIALVCDRVERIAGPLERPAATHALEGRPILFAATCTLSRRASAISCAPATPTRAAGVSANVVRSPTGTYAEFVPYNLVKDTVRQVRRATMPRGSSSWYFAQQRRSQTGSLRLRW